MKLSDAKKILSGELVIYRKSQELVVQPKGKPEDWQYLILTIKDCEFILRQLALKTAWRKKDRIMSINKAIKDACDRRLKS